MVIWHHELVVVMRVPALDSKRSAFKCLLRPLLSDSGSNRCWRIKNDDKIGTLCNKYLYTPRYSSYLNSLFLLLTVISAMKQRVNKAKRHLKSTYTFPACKEAIISSPATDLDLRRTSACGVQSCFCLSAQISSLRIRPLHVHFPQMVRERSRRLQSLFAWETEGRER